MVFELILDVKISIALFDQDVWIKLTMFDDEFYHYAYGKEGIKLFIDTFTEINMYSTRLFGKYHSINDKPSLLYYEDKIWHYAELQHRGNDLPAIISSTGTKYWLQYGKSHRDNDLPAVIRYNGEKKWYYNGLEHRDNDLSALITKNGSKYWFQNGQRSRLNGLPDIILVTHENA